MIAELKKLFNKEFSHMLTICAFCKRKISLILIDGVEDKISYSVCECCKQKTIITNKMDKLI